MEKEIIAKAEKVLNQEIEKIDVIGFTIKNVDRAFGTRLSYMVYFLLFLCYNILIWTTENR